MQFLLCFLVQFSPVIDVIVWINYNECFECRTSDRHILDSADGFFIVHICVYWQPETVHRLDASCGFFWLDANLLSICTVKIRLDTTSDLQTYCKLLKQLWSNLWIKSLDNQFSSSLLTTCSRLVIIKPEQAMQMHPDNLVGQLKVTENFGERCIIITKEKP